MATSSPVIRYAKSLAWLVGGGVDFRLRGKTHPNAYGALLAFHCATQGRSNDLLHGAVARLHPPVRDVDARGILDGVDVDHAADAVARDGFFLFPKLLDAETCDALVTFARTTPAKPTPAQQDAPARAIYDAAHPLSVLYRFDEADIFSCEAAQRLAADRSLLALAQRYLHCEPILDLAAMWWSARFSREPDVDSAQLFHFDMDRIKWLKFFVYLTDVDEDSGPHVYVRGSHRRGDPPLELLKAGYARFTDAQIEAHYPRERIVHVLGKRGTMFVADTRGFHRGSVPTSSDRLIFELEWADSLFGAVWERTAVRASSSSPLGRLAADHPRVTSKLDLTG